MKTISLKLEEELAESLEKSAKEMNTSKSNLVREALREYSKAGRAAVSGSCLDLFGKLFGCVDGPSDLSFNEEHLEGFGK